MSADNVDSLEYWPDPAASARRAQQLVSDARTYRRTGHLSMASHMLEDASAEDPQNTEIATELAIVRELNSKWGKLDYVEVSPAANVGTIVQARAAVDDLLQPTTGAPNSDELVNKKAQIDQVVEQMVADLTLSIRDIEAEIEGEGDVEDKLKLLGDPAGPAPCTLFAQLYDLYALDPNHSTMNWNRQWAASALNILTSLIKERTDILTRLAAIDPAGEIPAEQVRAVVAELVEMAQKPGAAGDPRIAAATQDLEARVKTYLTRKLQTGFAGAADLKSFSDILDIFVHYRVWDLSTTTSLRDELWASTHRTILALLPQALPAYASTKLRAVELIENWTHAGDILEGLRGLDSAGGKIGVFDTLEEEFARSVDRMLAGLGESMPRIAAAEKQERTGSAIAVYRYASTLPIPIKVRVQGLNSQAAPPSEQVVKENHIARNIGLAGVALATLLLGGLGAWMNKDAIEGMIGQPPAASVAPAQAPAAASTAAASFKQPIAPFFVPEARLDASGCLFVATAGDMGFNICNTNEGAVTTYFNDYYADPHMREFLGAPISKEFQDLEVAGRYVQYFEKGRLEESFYGGKPQAELGRLGDDLLRSMAASKPAIAGARIERAQPRNGCVVAVEKDNYWLCGDFLNFFNTGLGQPRSWDPIVYYGGTLTEEYTDSIAGTQVQRQFLERAIFQRRNNSIEALPVGILYANWVRGLALPLPVPWKPVLDPTEVTPSR